MWSVILTGTRRGVWGGILFLGPVSGGDQAVENCFMFETFNNQQLTTQPRYLDITTQPRYLDITIQPRYLNITIQPRYLNITTQPRYLDITTQPRYLDIHGVWTPDVSHSSHSRTVYQATV